MGSRPVELALLTLSQLLFGSVPLGAQASPAIVSLPEDAQNFLAGNELQFISAISATDKDGKELPDSSASND